MDDQIPLHTSAMKTSLAVSLTFTSLYPTTIFHLNMNFACDLIIYREMLNIYLSMLDAVLSLALRTGAVPPLAPCSYRKTCVRWHAAQCKVST